MKLSLIFWCFLGCFLPVNAQVGIVTSDPKATLHVEEDEDLIGGIIAPQLSRSQLIGKDDNYTTDHKGSLIYIDLIDGATTTPKTVYVNEVGFYVFNGSLWKKTEQDKKFFFLPSFSLPITALGTGFTFDIYQEIYLKQLTKSTPALPHNFIASNSTLLATQNKIYDRNQLDYVITYFDDDILKINSINPNGVINYDVLSLVFTPDTFINLILVVK